MYFIPKGPFFIATGSNGNSDCKATVILSSSASKDLITGKLAAGNFSARPRAKSQVVRINATSAFAAAKPLLFQIPPREALLATYLNSCILISTPSAGLPPISQVASHHMASAWSIALGVASVKRSFNHGSLIGPSIMNKMENTKHSAAVKELVVGALNTDRHDFK